MTGIFNGKSILAGIIIMLELAGAGKSEAVKTGESGKINGVKVQELGPTSRASRQPGGGAGPRESSPEGVSVSRTPASPTRAPDSLFEGAKFLKHDK